ncbi:MAG: glycosyltransferase [Clostridia bacterium]|nr:glycosyltransferase [Clostridia bacterium]
MKVIILSATTGGGHMSAANAISEYLSEQNIETKVVDTLEYISPILNKTITETYEFLAKRSPKLWKLMYNSSNHRAINKVVSSSNSLISRKLMPLLNDFKPDLIVSTHPFATEMISKLKSLNKINLPLVCVMTDYAPHRTWISSGVDAYVVANENMIEPMAKMGVNTEIIHPFGIPVDEDFFSEKNKGSILSQMDLSLSIPTLLIMAGSCGFANMENVYKKLQKSKIDFQIIIITGKNPRLYNSMQSLISGSETKKHHKFIPKFKIQNINLHNLRIFKNLIKKGTDKVAITKPTKIIYFTSEVSKYMAAADIIITKPGGLTISEALACNLPMALFDAIPGQEEENAEFLVSHNMAVKLDSKKENIEVIENLLSNPEELRNMRYNCENFDKSGSLANIHTLIKSLVKYN